MKKEEAASYYEKILVSYGIQPTHRRIEILKIIHLELDDITITKVYEVISNEKREISFGTVITTLGLFKIKGLLKEIDNESNLGRPGRPEKKLIYSPNKAL